MVIKSVELETVCGITSELPDTDKPEVAFAGKSNVGKSSLINGLMNRKALARTSAQPGKTQTINYYNINNCMYLVDLPGYGYAKITLREKEKWGRMIENYLHTSRQLKAVFLLIDIRHEPSDNDRQMYDWIVYQGFDPIIIATKSDKVSRRKLPDHIRMIREGLNLKSGTPLFPYSALTKQGKEEIWEYMDELLGLFDENAGNVSKRSENNGNSAIVSSTGHQKAGEFVSASGTKGISEQAAETPARKPRRKAEDLPKKLLKKKKAAKAGKKKKSAKTGGKREKK